MRRTPIHRAHGIQCLKRNSHTNYSSNVQITGTSTVCLVVALFKRTPVQRARLRIYGPLWSEVICHTGPVMRDWSPCHDVTSINSALTRHDNVIIFTIPVFNPEGILCLAFPFLPNSVWHGIRSWPHSTHWRRDARVIISPFITQPRCFNW